MMIAAARLCLAATVKLASTARIARGNRVVKTHCIGLLSVVAFESCSPKVGFPFEGQCLGKRS